MTAWYFHELWLWKSKLWGSWIFWFEETYADMDHVKQRVLQSGTGKVSFGPEKYWTFLCVCVCRYVPDLGFFFLARLSLEDRFLEITSTPYKEQGMDMNPMLSTQWGQVNRSKCLKFSLGSDCIHFLTQFSLPHMSFFMSLHAQSPHNPLRHSHKVTSSTKLSIIRHLELLFSFLNLPSHFYCKFTWRIPLSDLHGDFVLA